MNHHIQVSAHLADGEPVGSLELQRLQRDDLFEGRAWFTFRLADVSVHAASLEQLEDVAGQLLAFVGEQRLKDSRELVAATTGEAGVALGLVS